MREGLLVGGTGYVGSVVAEELVGAGHEVLGLARSEEAAAKLEDRGLAAHRGDLRDAGSLDRGVRETDAAVYCAAGDAGALEAIVGALAGSDKPFAYLTGALLYGDTGGEEAGEHRPLRPPPPLMGLAHAERAVLSAAGRGVRSSSVRAALVYGRGGGAVLATLLEDARKAGVARHVGDGENRWAAVHVDDLAGLIVDALEGAPAGTPFNASAGNVSLRGVARSVGSAVGAGSEPRSITPEEARGAWGFFADPLSRDLMLSGERARRVLGWNPTCPSLFEDLELGSYQKPEPEVGWAVAREGGGTAVCGISDGP